MSQVCNVEDIDFDEDVEARKFDAETHVRHTSLICLQQSMLLQRNFKRKGQSYQIIAFFLDPVVEFMSTGRLDMMSEFHGFQLDTRNISLNAIIATDVHL